MKQQVFEYLSKLRESGEINMFGAVPYLQEKFDISYEEARDLMLEWMKNG